ncbi:MAG: PAS domain S-box protein [Chloroflexi bacterium]|nr:PAS domain S-box protein [Chloroflexota bacterium]
MDAKGIIREANRSLLRLLVISGEELIGHEFVTLASEFALDGQRQLADFRERLTGGTPATELTFLNRDGKQKTIALQSSPFRSGGRVTGVVYTIQDITERKRAEEALRETRDYLENLLDYANAPIIVWDPQFRITRFNHAFERLTGHKAAGVVGQQLDILFPEHSREESLAHIRRAAAGERWEVVEIPILRVDGTARTVLWNSATIYASDGKTVVATIAQGQDITERKQAEEKLGRSHATTKMVTDSLDALVYVADMQTYELLYVNMYGQAVWGDIVGKPCWQTLQKGQDGPCSFCTNDRLLNPDGSPAGIHVWEFQNTVTGRWYQCRDRAIQWIDGRVVRMEIASDITERKQAEEERERLNAELAEKNKEMEQIIYITSHDLRSPLVNVLGFTKELGYSLQQITTAVQSSETPPSVQKKLMPVLEKDVPEAMGYILASASKMDTLLIGLLRLSRAGRAVSQFEVLDMNQMLSDIGKSFEYRIREKGATLNIGSVPSCMGNAEQINQVFFNLLDNALKYLDPKRPGIIGITGRREGNTVVYCVADNGIGIARQYHDKIFEMFHQVDPAASGGEGMGLAIVKKILGRHRGKIWVESEPGVGSRFDVSLPSGNHIGQEV